jgi:hypothetical protein
MAKSAGLTYQQSSRYKDKRTSIGNSNLSRGAGKNKNAKSLVKKIQRAR